MFAFLYQPFVPYLLFSLYNWLKRSVCVYSVHVVGVAIVWEEHFGEGSVASGMG
ncbi:hypothetical protein Q7O44_12165 [Shigella flexneri]|nr:hypothetical protein [Shigella flexneri]